MWGQSEQPSVSWGYLEGFTPALAAVSPYINPTRTVKHAHRRPTIGTSLLAGAKSAWEFVRMCDPQGPYVLSGCPLRKASAKWGAIGVLSNPLLPRLRESQQYTTW